MRLRLLLRRLTVSAPRMAVRSALPWPLRWVLWAVVAGLCAAIGLWVFEFGRDIAGLDKGCKEPLQQLRDQVDSLHAQLDQITEERNQAQSVAHTVDTVRTTDKVTQEKLLAQNKQLTQDNQRLKEDLGFFEQLIPAAASDAHAHADTLAIRSLQGEKLATGELKWQMLVIQSVKNPSEFNGQLEVTLAGTLFGKPWSNTPPEGMQAIKLKQYGRVQGVFKLPAGVEVSSITVRILEGSVVKTMQTTRISDTSKNQVHPIF